MPANDSDATTDTPTHLLRRRVPPPTAAAMDIGGPTPGRTLARRGVRLLAGVALFLLAATAFERFTASLRVALVVVGVMAAYMLVVGRVVEGRADRID